MAYREGGAPARPLFQRAGTAADVVDPGLSLRQSRQCPACWTNPMRILEILRQREIYRLLSETAEQSGSQVIAASHSEVLLNEAAERDLVIAFVRRQTPSDRRPNESTLGKPSPKSVGTSIIRLSRKAGSSIWKAPTGLAILQSLCRDASGPFGCAIEALQAAVCSLLRQPATNRVRRSHFYGLGRGRCRSCKGISPVSTGWRAQAIAARADLRVGRSWSKREIENYLCTQATLEAWAAASRRRTNGADRTALHQSAG